MFFLTFNSSTQVRRRHELLRDSLVLILVYVKQLFSLLPFSFSLFRIQVRDFIGFGYLGRICVSWCIIRLSNKSFFNDFIQLIFLYQYLRPINVIIWTWSLNSIHLFSTQLLRNIKFTLTDQFLKRFNLVCFFGKALIIIGLLGSRFRTHIITQSRLIDYLHLRFKFIATV